MNFRQIFLKVVLINCLAISPLCYAMSVKVRLEGLDEALTKTITPELTISEHQTDDELTEETLKSYHEQTLKELPALLEPLGYYHSDITGSLTHEGKKWRAAYRVVNLGPPVRIKTVTLSLIGAGKDVSRLKKSLDKFPLKSGDILDQSLYKKGKKTWMSQAVAVGYLQAAYSQKEIKIDRDTNQAWITLTLDTHQPYSFGELSFSGSQLSPSFLARYAPFTQGSPYLQSSLATFQQGLITSNYFDAVDILPKVPSDLAETQVPLAVNLKDKKPNQYRFGIGYGTDTGARGLIAWERRHLNQHGHRFDLKIRAAEKENTLLARYVFPGTKPVTDHYQIIVGREQESIDDRIFDTWKAGFSETRRLGDWRRVLGVHYELESYRPLMGKRTLTSRLLLPSVKYLIAKKDDPLNPTKGYYFSAEVRGTHMVLGSTTSLAQSEISGRYLHPLGQAGTLLLRSTLGATVARQEDDVPLSLRFFAGGDESVRGFGYQSLGPKEVNGDGVLTVVGGRYLVTLSAEYEHVLYNQFSGAVFVDSGNAMDDLSEGLETGAGLGLIWRSPVGPIRIDAAKPLSSEAKSIRFHIRFGPSF